MKACARIKSCKSEAKLLHGLQAGKVINMEHIAGQMCQKCSNWRVHVILHVFESNMFINRGKLPHNLNKIPPLCERPTDFLLAVYLTMRVQVQDFLLYLITKDSSQGPQHSP